MGNIIVLIIILIIIISAVTKIIVEKRRGAKCIGCPYCKTDGQSCHASEGK